MTVLPKKVFPHPTLAWSVVSELEEDPKECQCEIKCLVPVCGLALYLKKKKRNKLENYLSS